MPALIRFSLLLASLAAVLPQHAQTQSVSTPRKVCWRGQPQPACDVFWITELGFYPRLGATIQGQPPAIDAHGSAEIGRMVNKGRSAQGVLITFGPNERYGLLLRHRRWIGEQGTFDLTAGGIQTTINHSRESHLDKRGFGLTGDIALGWRDYGQIVLRGDLARSEDRTAGTLYGGVRLGSKPAAGAAITGGILLGTYFALFMIGMANADF